MSTKNFVSNGDAETLFTGIGNKLSTLKSGLTTLDNEVNGDAVTYPYADVITISDAVPSNLADCSVKIEPVQDLHGYDHPWVGGAGKNKLPLTVDIVKSLNGGGTWTGNTYNFRDVDFTVNTDSDGNVTSVKVNGTASQNVTLLLNFVGTASTEYYIGGCPAGGGNTYYFDTFSDGVPRTADYGSGATFTADGNSQYVRIGVQQGYNAQNLMFYPMICLNSETDKSFAPYTNYCPITGHTEASVQRDGVNLCDKGEGNVYNGGKLIPVSAGDKIYCYGEWVSDNKSFYGAIFSTPTETSKGNKIAILDDFYTGVSKEMTISTNGYFGVCFDTSVESYTVSKMMISRTPITSATDYEPYQGKTYTISLGDTIYGGTVDFDSGVMTVNRAMFTLDGTEQGWSTDVTSGGKRRFSNAQLPSLGYTTSAGISAVSNLFKNTRSSDYDLMDNVFILRYINNTNRIDIMTEQFADVTEWTTFLGTTNMQVLYMLATPTTIQLTPQQIQLLKGTNTLTASTGQISVTVNGVSGAIGQVQEQVNELAEDVAGIDTRLSTVESDMPKKANIISGGFMESTTKTIDITSIGNNKALILVLTYHNYSMYALFPTNTASYLQLISSGGTNYPTLSVTDADTITLTNPDTVGGQYVLFY